MMPAFLIGKRVEESVFVSVINWKDDFSLNQNAINKKSIESKYEEKGSISDTADWHLSAQSLNPTGERNNQSQFVNFSNRQPSMVPALRCQSNRVSLINIHDLISTQTSN